MSTNPMTVAEFVANLPDHPCIVCGGPRSTHQFSVLGGPDGWLCEQHKDEPVTLDGVTYGETQRRADRLAGSAA